MKTIKRIVKKAGSWIIQTFSKPMYYTNSEGVIPLWELGK